MRTWVLIGALTLFALIGTLTLVALTMTHQPPDLKWTKTLFDNYVPKTLFDDCFGQARDKAFTPCPSGGELPRGCEAIISGGPGRGLDVAVPTGYVNHLKVPEFTEECMVAQGYKVGRLCHDSSEYACYEPIR